MNRRSISTIALFLVVTGLSIPQTATTYLTPEIRRVGDKLACKCGSCNNTVATCQMLECHYTSPARTKIATQLKEGKSDQAIIDGFVKEVGLAALAAPPAEGFNLLGYVMPFAAILLGLAAILVYWKRFKQPAAAVQVEGAAPSPPPTAADEKYRKQIEAELAEMD
ncbi:MAG: cytochrome c-type biogenesis protein CcmH [Bryobacteraceae bacterium]|nr:cytochrome c-type biogenesis protein CcmH [Bryobacteraceae bacterium]